MVCVQNICIHILGLCELNNLCFATLVLADLKESMFPCARLCPEPDPEELCAFTDLYGSPRFLLSFQVVIQAA